MEAFTKAGWQIVDLVLPINLNSLACRIECYYAVITALQVFLQVSSHLRGHRVVDQVVELGQKLSAGHFSPAFFRRK